MLDKASSELATARLVAEEVGLGSRVAGLAAGPLWLRASCRRGRMPASWGECIVKEV